MFVFCNKKGAAYEEAAVNKARKNQSKLARKYWRKDSSSLIEPGTPPPPPLSGDVDSLSLQCNYTQGP